jgi:hypothetical protein
MRRLPACAIIAFGAALCVATSACAADPGFCRAYAKAALVQVRGALASSRCAAAIQGARWSTDFSVHYEWCLGASFADAGAERDARTRFLKSCS